MKKFVLCAVSLLLLVSLTSCGNLAMKKETTFTVEEALTKEEKQEVERKKKDYYTTMSITLNGNFKQHEPLSWFGNYAAILDSSNAKILVTNTAVKDYNDMSAYEYAVFQNGNSAYSYPVVHDEETGLVSYRYNSSIFGSKFSGVCYVFRTTEDIWLVDMACSPKDIEKMIPYFEEWAKSVTFDEECPIYNYVLE